jgi:small Trp-rich protein
MYLVWLGAILILLKVLDFGPLIEVSWWWVLAPLAAAFVWFEWLEKLCGLDRRKVEHLESERRRKERVQAEFQSPAGKATRR